MWSAAHGPENLNERASIASELECATTERVAPETQLVSQLFTLYSLLERGSIEAFDRKADVFRATAVQLQQPQGLWYAAMLDGMRALLRGDFDKGAQLAENFAALGKKANDANAAHSALAHAALICFERGDLVTIIPAAESMARQYPSVVVWRAALSWMLALAGRRDQAIAVMNSIGAERLSSLPKRMDWSGTLALLGEAAALAGDIGSARHLYEQLEPLRKSCVIHGLCTLSWGSAARVMGLLSECLGYLDRAVAELEDAVALNSDIGALPWVAHSQVALARVLMRRSTKAATLREAKGLLSQAVATTQALRMTNLEKVARQMLPSAR
jgi:tetratricopeptide (TPR) repeat protein